MNETRRTTCPSESSVASLDLDLPREAVVVAGDAEASRVWVVTDDWVDLVDGKRMVGVVEVQVYFGD